MNTAVGSIAYLKDILKRLNVIPKELAELRIKRRNLALKIYANIQRLTEIYRELYAPVQGFIERDELANKFSLNFDVSIIDVELNDRFFDWVRQDVIGSFCGGPSGGRTHRQ